MCAADLLQCSPVGVVGVTEPEGGADVPGVLNRFGVEEDAEKEGMSMDESTDDDRFALGRRRNFFVNEGERVF